MEEGKGRTGEQRKTVSMENKHEGEEEMGGRKGESREKER